MKMDDIYVVAVGSQPLLWAVQCDVCDDIVSEETEDGDQADLFAESHLAYHLAKDFA